MPGKSSENLREILEQLQSGLQPDFGKNNSLAEILCFSNAVVLAELSTSDALKLPGMDTTSTGTLNFINLNQEEEEDVKEDEAALSMPAPLISTKHVSFHLPPLVEEKKELLKAEEEPTKVEEIPQQARQSEKNVVVDLLQQVNEKREWSSRVQNILDSATSQFLREKGNLTTCQLLSEANVLVAVGFDHEEDSLKIQLEDVEKRHLPKRGLFGKKPISDEQYLGEKTSIEQSQVALQKEQELVSQLFVQAIHQEVVKSSCSESASGLTVNVLKPESKRSTPKLERSIFLDSKKFPSKYPDVLPSDTLPNFIEYSSQLHPVQEQKELQVNGAAIAIKTIQEWQDFMRSGSLVRLSAACLEKFAGETATCVEGLINVLRTRGVGSEQDYQEFLDIQTTQRIKSKAVLHARAALHMTDKVYVAPNLVSLQSALYLEGPTLLTFPVYNANLSSGFWVRGGGGDPASEPLGYHTVMVVGYNNETSTFKIRDSLGQSFGRFGCYDISYADAFVASSVALVLAPSWTNEDEGKNLRRASRVVKQNINVAKQITTSKELFPQNELEKAQSKAKFYKRQWQSTAEQIKRIQSAPKEN